MTDHKLPENWRLVKIGELCLPVKNSHPSRLDSKEFNYIDIASIDNQLKRITDVQTLSVENSPSRARQILATADVIVSTVRPGLNAVALVPEDLNGAIGSTGFCVLRANQDVLLPEFLFAWVRHPSFLKMLLRLERGIGFPAVSNSDVYQVHIPLPPLSEQQKIIEMLHEADTLRQLRQQATQKAEDLLPALFHSMFGRPKSIWSTVKLKDLIKLEAGRNLLARNEPATLNEKGVLKVSAVTSGIYKQEENKALPDETKFLSQYEIKDLDLLINRANTEDLVGSSVIVWRTRSNLMLPDKLWRVILRETSKNKLDLLFLHGLLNTPQLRSEISRYAAGTSSSMQNISQENFLDIEILLPSFAEQYVYSEAMELYWNTLKKEFQQTDAELETLFQSLLTRAFIGELTSKYRQSNHANLRKEVLNRNVTLGIARQRHTTLDLEEDDQRNRLTYHIRRQLPATLTELLDIATNEKSITQQSFPALMQMVEEVAPALPDKEDRLFDLINSLMQNVQHGLRQQFVAAIEAIMQRILPFYQQDLDTKVLLEMLLKSATNISEIAPHAPQATRMIRTHEEPANCIDDRLQKLLTAIEHRPPYFRAFDLVHDSIGVAEVTAGLRILEAFGFIRRVVWETDLDPVFRLVDPANPDDAIHRNSEER